MALIFETARSAVTDRLVARPHWALQSRPDAGASSPLGDLASWSSGAYVGEYVASHEGRPYIRVDNIRPYVCNLNGPDVVYARAPAGNAAERITAADGDVLIARTGTLGKATLVAGSLAGAVLSQHVTRIKCGLGLDPGFLAAYLNSGRGRSQLLGLSHGSTRLELTHSSLGELRVQAPSIREQRKVGADVREAVALYYEALAEVKQAIADYETALGVRAQAEPSMTFSGPVEGTSLWTPKFHEPGRVRLCRDVERRCRTRPLGDIATIARGKGTRTKQYERAGIPFMRTTGLINWGTDPFPDHYASPETYGRFRQPVREGDMLVSIEGKIGSVALLSGAERCVFKNHIEWVRVDGPAAWEDVFLCLASRYGRAQFERLTVVQSTLPGLSDRLRLVRIPSPDGIGGLEAMRGALRSALGKRARAMGLLRAAHAVVEQSSRAQ